jgi:NADPH:quinone reductase-like Zn-dependent oxidoreductase
MRAIVTTGAEDVKTIEVAVPEAGPGEVRIELRAAAVNPVDSQTRQGIYHRLGWIDQPEGAGLGWDAAGIVDALGDGVVGPAVGTRVVALHDRLDAPLRAFADYVVVPATAVARIPDGLNFAGAATLPLNLSTADQALDLLGDPAGRTLLVTGAAGGVGGFAVPLAVERGWTVSALGRPTDTDFLRSAVRYRFSAKFRRPGSTPCSIPRYSETRRFPRWTTAEPMWASCRRQSPGPRAASTFRP